MKIGWAANLRRHPVSGQRRRLIEFGVPETKIYDETRGDDIKDMLRDATKGGVIHVDRMAALAKNRAGWRIFTDLIAGKTVSIVEVSTGRKLALPHDGAEMFAMMTDDWSDNRMTSAQAKNAGRKGAKSRWKGKVRTPIRAAAKIWKDWTNYPRPEDALSHPDMAGWSVSTARRLIGKRGAPAGPIANRDTE